MNSRILAIVLVTCLLAAGALAQTGDARHFLRGAYQQGSVMGTNDFVNGDNLAGRPIDRYHSARLEFGWQTDGSQDWHQVYNDPSFGFGIYSADFFNDEELGRPTSLYGFFTWPFKRLDRSSFNFEAGFGLTDNWVAHDPATNPKNVAIGAGRSVHIDFGANWEYRLARRWSMLAGFTATHFSNGGSQQPNYGINQVGLLAYAKYHAGELRPREARRPVAPYTPDWKLTTFLSGGIRNVSVNPADYQYPGDVLYKDYFIGNVIVTANRRTSHMSSFGLGLDATYDESVDGLMRLEGFRQGRNQSASFGDKLGLGLAGGYEHVVHRGSLLVHLGYDLLRQDVEGRLPRFYQRLGLRYYVAGDLAVGLNVRFHEFSRADNLEINFGRSFGL